MKKEWKDIAKRAGKTFVQAFVGAISIEQLSGIMDIKSFKTVMYSMLMAGVAAGVSAVWNMVIKWKEQRTDGEGY